MFEKFRLQDALVKYKQNFVSTQWGNEKYKWEAVKFFQDNWDVNAENFASMLTLSISKTYNLLASMNNFPARMIEKFAETAPEEVRAMFIALFDESKDVVTRITDFKDQSSILLEKYGNGAGQHYQYENAVSTYLWLRYPDNYYIYKYGEVKTAADELSSDYRFKKGAYADNLRNFYSFYDELCVEIKNDEELVGLFKSQLTDDCYPDPEFRTLTIDVGFYISRYFSQKESVATDDWFPTDYTPNISIDEWVELLNEPDVFTTGSLEIMKRIKDYGGQATCTQLSIKYKDTNGNTAADDDTYNLIMRDKEDLLSFKTKLRFIFSHSALREGWDNPNVFQICTLNETHSKVKKRQEIGRGLRLCVNQDGERQHGFAINTLTVMANESYEEYAATLQHEYEEDEGIRFGVIESHTFANIPVKQADGSVAYLGAEKSELIYTAFKASGYIDGKDQVTDTLKTALKTNTLTVPEPVAAQRDAIAAVCKKASGNLNIKSAGDKRTVSLNKELFLGEDFKALWDKIKYKTTYAVDFSSDELVEKCCDMMRQNLNVSAAKLMYSKAKVQVTEGGVGATETQRISVLTTDVKERLPDIVTYLQNRTNLTRKTIVKLLTQSGTLPLFKKNPQAYMEEAARTITSVMRLLIVDGIKYTKLGDGEYYAQELFDSEELTGYLERNMIESHRSVYNYVVYDSEVERGFAESFESNESVKVYAKLPDWFKISTPLGSYNPDWAVVIEDNGLNKLYFVVETKGDTQFDSLRPTEREKIRCGEKHFAALGQEVTFTKAKKYVEFLSNYG